MYYQNFDMNGQNNVNGQPDFQPPFYNNFNRKSLPAYYEEKARIRKISYISSAFLLASFIISFIISLFMRSSSSFLTLYKENNTFANAFYILYSTLSVFLPALVINIIISKKYKGIDFSNSYAKPQSKTMFVLAVFAGLAISFAADYIVNIISYIFSSFDIEQISSDKNTSNLSALGIVVSIVATAIIPALNEEFALRCTILQPLRKGGDWFAIITSAFIFGLLHGSPNQIPFAFIAGIGMGYYSVATGSVFTGVAIHFLNNLFAVVFWILQDLYPDYNFNKISSIIMVSIVIIGFICATIFALSNKKQVMQNPPSILTTGDKVKAFLLNPPMIITIIIFVGTALLQLRKTGASSDSSLGMVSFLL
ncbi:MAG: CPBP family intramembrane metalloprotease [Clostridiales bacterium]|nr:CPBP family intramembrane metalloprotease [Clostridiales bacterium]